MIACTFFGHRDCPDTVKPVLKKVLIDLIENHSVDQFYVGQQGAFDRQVFHTLKEQKGIYPHICYSVVLDRLPKITEKDEICDFSNTLFPEGIEQIHPRFAISWRNEWMLKQSDFVVTCIRYSWGGAAKFAEMAKKQKKQVINLKLE